ncbi:hypothetical protein B0H16DRAFT_1623111 [Mycena metata]|uniref:Uncharacterized protein n=1 Tax=Mycena metata TaxID=1033252 RepID=A0AAD7MDX8_9AGAR|nr:hypothetical protein B0H16DRAFT_1623111 [Mycena metata]
MWRETVVGAMFRQAMAASPARAARDYRALVWTVKSLADNTELEPFVEGLPDLLWGPENRRYTYEDHIQQLTRTADLGLLSRIEELLRSCHSGLLTAPARTQREIACYKALWAIASIQTSPILPRTPLPLDFWQFARHYNWPSPDLGMHHYSRSAVLLMKRSIFCHLQSLLAVPVSKLSEDVSLGLVPDLKSFVHYVKRQHWYWDVSFPGFMTQRLLQYYNTTADTSNTGDISELVADVVQAFETFSKQTPYKLFFDYCIWAAEQETLPYRFSETEEIILPSDNRPANFAAYAALLEDALANIVYHIPLDSSKWSEPTTQCFDIVIQRFCTLWSPEDSDSLPIPHTLTRYFATRKIHSVIHNCLWSSGIIRPLLHAIPATLSGPLDSRYWRHLDAREDTLTTLWHAAYTARSFFTPHICHSILTALADGPRTPAGFWSTVMMKTVLASFKSVPMPDAQADPTLVETRLTLLAEFLEGWTSDFTPYEPALTMRWIGILAKVAKSQQLRLAASINRALTAHIDNPRSFEVLDALMNSALGVPIFRWLDEPTARNQIKSILSDYLQRLTSTSNLIQHGALLRKLEEVVRLLESSHPPEE